LTNVFSRLTEAGLKLGPSKCLFTQRKCVFLGQEISSEGIRPPSDKVEIIQCYLAPKNIKELRRILGLFNWFRKFIPNFSTVASPIAKSLLKKGTTFRWDFEQQNAFQELKSLLKNSPA